MNKIARAIIIGNVIQFDNAGWKMVKAVAAQRRKSPKYIVIQALKRVARKQNGKKS